MITPASAQFTLTGPPAAALAPVLSALAARLGVEISLEGGAGTVVNLALSREPHADPRAPAGTPPTGESVNEAYRIEPTAEVIEVRAASAAGLFRALTTIIQHSAIGAPLPALTDAPALAWRGLSLDIARDFRPVSEIEAIIDLLALYKMSVLHVHLSDNQGWRLESAAYPRLTEAGPHLTRAEFSHLVAYARDRFVTIVPELDMPGHTASALHAYPELAEGTEFAHDLIRYLNPRTEAAMTFARTVITELAELTPHPFIHVGGDEAFGMPEELFTEFFTELLPHLRSLGKRAVAWQEVTRTGALTPADLVQLWVSPKDSFDAGALKAKAPVDMHPLIDIAARTFDLAPTDAARAAQQGVPVILSPSSPMYFDRRYADPGSDPRQQERRDRVGFPNYEPEPIAGVHAFDPFTLAAQQGVTIAGAEAALWAETITSFDDVAFLLLPRLPIAAGRMWGPGSTPWSEAWTLLRAHAPVWEALGFTEHFRP